MPSMPVGSGNIANDSGPAGLRRFCRTVFLFVVLFLGINFMGNRILRPRDGRSADNLVQRLKDVYFAKNAGKYNAVFFGSSLTYRHVNPGVIDDELGEFHIRSFNFGSPATSNPEALYLFEDFIAKLPSSSAVRFAFLELTDLTRINPLNQFSPRSYYYLDFRYMKFIVRYFFADPRLDWIKKIGAAYPYVQGYFLNNFLLAKPTKARMLGRKYLGGRKDGYYGLDVDLKENKSRELLDRRLAFLRDTSVLTKRLPNKKAPVSLSLRNPVYLEFLNELLSRAEIRNIELYFVIPPRLPNYQALYPLKKCIRGNRVIDLSGYAEFYSPALSFDRDHLNSTGADILSACLAREFKSKLGAGR